MVNLLHKALNILYESDVEYGFPTGLKRVDDSAVEISFKDRRTVKVFVEEERVIEL